MIQKKKIEFLIKKISFEPLDHTAFKKFQVYKIGSSTLRTFGKGGGAATPAIPRVKVFIFFSFIYYTHNFKHYYIFFYKTWNIPPLILPTPRFSLKYTLFRHIKEKRKVTLIKSKILKN